MNVPAHDGLAPAGGDARSPDAPSSARALMSSWRVIQGGMGVGISNWRLARAVSLRGQLGVVSGTGLDTLFIRRLQDGDAGGHLRRGMEAHPDPDFCAEIRRRWFRPEGRPAGEPYGLLPLDGRGVDPWRQRLISLASFVEVFLAKEGHAAPVGFNLLTKIPMPNLASLHGAMLAGVDVILMGAGIPREIPAALEALAEGREAAIRMEVLGMPADAWPWFRFDPRGLHPASGAPLARPLFMPIVSSNLLASVLVKKSTGRIDGLVVEGPTAGGHNAPPRGDLRLNERGEPIYSERDDVDLERIAALGLPFWLAGGMSRKGSLARARAAGATGIQVGTLFAFCRESGLAEPLRRQVLAMAREGSVDVLTDPQASSTGFPFKVLALPGSLSDPEVYQSRQRACDLGYLRLAFQAPDGRIAFRCPAEPVATHVARGGTEEATRGRKCLCNALMANAGVPQALAGGGVEPPMLTAGDEARDLRAYLGDRADTTAADVLDYLLS